MSDTPTNVERLREVERRVDDHDNLIAAILTELRTLNARLDKWEKRGLVVLGVWLAGSDNGTQLLEKLLGA